MYDGSTATAEAVMMAQPRHAPEQGRALAGGLHPHYAEVDRDLGRHGFERLRARRMSTASEDLAGAIDDETSCVVVQNPDFFGNLRDLAALAEACHAKPARCWSSWSPRSSRSASSSRPARWGPISSSPKGNRSAMRSNFGGPYVGLFATREKSCARCRAGLRRDRRCRRPARLCADPLGARAAYPAREGDQEYLHQFRPLRAGFHDPSRACSARPASHASPSSTMPRP